MVLQFLYIDRISDKEKVNFVIGSYTNESLPFSCRRIVSESPIRLADTLINTVYMNQTQAKPTIIGMFPPTGKLFNS
jgi:hypothetical protein